MKLYRVLMNAAALPGLNLLRVLAALYIVMYHLHPAFLPDSIQSFFSAGSADTSLFFILSGFLLTHLYAGQPMDNVAQQRFVWKRVARIFPANILGLLFFLTLQQAFGHVNYDWVTLFQCFILVQTWTVGSAYAFNVPAWSMSCLLFFYFIFPVVLMRLKCLRTETLQLVLLVIWITSAFIVPMLTFIPVDFQPSLWEQYLHNSPLTRSPEFILGMGIALLVARKGTFPVWYFWLSVPFMFGSLIVLSEFVSGIKIGLLAPLSLSLMLAFINPGPLVERLGRSKYICTLSNASICIFMLHMTWTQIFSAWLFRLWHLEWNFWTLILYLITVMSSAILADRWICQPCTRLLTGRAHSPRTQTGYNLPMFSNQPTYTVTSTHLAERTT